MNGRILKTLIVWPYSNAVFERISRTRVTLQESHQEALLPAFVCLRSDFIILHALSHRFDQCWILQPRLAIHKKNRFTQLILRAGQSYSFKFSMLDWKSLSTFAGGLSEISLGSISFVFNSRQLLSTKSSKAADAS